MSKFLNVAAGIAVTLASAASARADIVYNLSNVSLSTAPSGAGGTAVGALTGSFTTNDARSAIVSFNINASAAGSFAGFTYTPSTASVTAFVLPSLFFQLDGQNNELRLYFTSSLTSAGTTLSSPFSYENEPSGGNRFPIGSIVAATATTPVSAVPEPASLAALTAGLIGLAAIRRRKV